MSTTMRRLAADVAAGTPPDESYTADMREAYAEMAAELVEARRLNPAATMWIPADVDGLPGGEDERTDETATAKPATVRVAARLSDGTMHEVAPMSTADAADAMRQSPGGAVQLIFDPRTQSSTEIYAAMCAFRREARKRAGLPDDPELDDDED